MLIFAFLLLNAFVLILEFFSRIVDRTSFVCYILALILTNKYLSKILQKLVIKTNKKKRNCVEAKVKEIYTSILMFFKLKINATIIL